MVGERERRPPDLRQTLHARPSVTTNNLPLRPGMANDRGRPRRKDWADAITFDFQQNLEMPILLHNDMFYLHQMWTYNF